MTTYDKELFSLMDHLRDEDVYEFLNETPTGVHPEVPGQAVKDIKARTYQKLGIAPAKDPSFIRGGKRRRFWSLLAASVAVAVLFTASLGHDSVWARLQKALQYIPGLNIVIEDQEREVERFVLEGPVEKKIGNGVLRIEGAVVDENNAVIEISGLNIPPYDQHKMYFRNAKGERFYIDSHSMGAGSVQWQGTYVHQGYIADREGLQFIVPAGNNIAVDLPLVKAKRYTSYNEMGATSNVNGISITAVPSMEKGKTRINLVSPPLPGMRIESYGTDPYLGKTEVALKDSAGKIYEMAHDSSYMGALSEFYFDTGEQGPQGMTLTIPRVGVILDNKASVRIWIPRSGEAELDKTVDLGGFPVVFEKIRRIQGNKVQIDVDTGFSPEAREALYNFRLDGMSYSAQYDFRGQTGAFIKLEFEINPNQLWVTLKLSEPLVNKKGPWEIKF